MVLALEIRKDRTPVVLRKLAKETDDARAAAAVLAGTQPVERVWLHLKERFLSHRLLAADAASRAWNRLVAETGRLTSLCSYPWISKVKR